MQELRGNTRTKEIDNLMKARIAQKNRWNALCEDTQIPLETRRLIRLDHKDKELTPRFFRVLLAQKHVSKYREVVRKHFPRTLHIIEFIDEINQATDDNDLVDQRAAVFNDLLEEFEYFEVNDDDHKRLFRRIESNAAPDYLHLSIEQLSQLNRAYPQYGLLINEIDPSNCLVTPRRRATQQATAMAEDDNEQDASSSSSSSEAVTTQTHTQQFSDDLALNPNNPYDKNLLDACLNYTGLHYTVTSNHMHSVLAEREDGSEAYKHFLLIAPAEKVEQNSLGKLKMFPKLNAHLNLAPVQKRNTFERIAYKKAGAGNVSYKWQCVDPDVTVSASELALLPRECAVGTIVITRSTASRIAHRVLAAGGAVPAYLAAHEAKKQQTHARSTTTQSTGVSRQRSSTPASAPLAEKNSGITTSRKRKSTVDESDDNGDEENERSEESADNDVTSTRPLRTGIKLNLKDLYDQRIADGCLAYTGLAYSAGSLTVLSKTVERADGSEAYKHFVLIIPPETTISRANEHEMLGRVITHFPLIPAQKRNVFVRVRDDASKSQRSKLCWKCVDSNYETDPENEDLLPRDCPQGAVVVIRGTAHVLAHAILAPDVLPQAYRDAYDLKQKRELARTSSNATTSQTTHQPTSAKRAKIQIPAAASRFSALAQDVQQDDDLPTDDNPTDEVADVFPHDDEEMSQSATRPAAKARPLPTHTAQTSRVGVATSTTATTLAASNAATTQPASTFARVMQTLTPAAVPDVLAQLGAFADDELPQETKELMRLVEEQEKQIKEVKNDIAQRMNVTLEALLSQQRKELEDVQRKQARLSGGLLSPQQTPNAVSNVGPRSK